ncbi:uncharacterized protein LOC121731205 [Aricia agestis]|uniref:uncharacterized protein LOC121731205 n=1 Tax=Aricia agestis TaxID=91739 RepID=UPI001C206C11|nr:uncharacterized protein LOC121731205 [Aricia agestis]
MQELLARQSAIIKEIENIHINYKKDSAIRKTPEYFEKRIAAIDNLWGEFEQNNKTLQGVEDKSSEYFKKNIYSEVKHFYTTFRATVTVDSERPATPTISQLSTPSTSKENAGTQFQIPKIYFEQVKPRLDYQDILVQQYANFRALERQLKRISEQNIEEKWEIEDELHNLQQRWRNIDELHLRIDILSSGTDTDYEEAFTEIESKYITAKRSLNQKLCSNAHVQQSLPQIDIPIFTGNYEQWPTFHDLYTEAIHNNKYITDAQKMQHLKCKVKGEAERIIQHLHISAENYEIAWEILNHRYNNPQLLFTKQVEILLSQPTSHKQSSYELKKLYDTTTECIHAIHNLGVDANSWDPLLVHILCKKLDVDTYTNYQESRKEPRSIPTLEEFMTFIESKFTALEPIQHREKENNITSKQVYQAPRSSNYNKNSTWSQYQNEHSQKGQYQAFVTYRQKSCRII